MVPRGRLPGVGFGEHAAHAARGRSTSCPWPRCGTCWQGSPGSSRSGSRCSSDRGLLLARPRREERDRSVHLDRLSPASSCAVFSLPVAAVRLPSPGRLLRHRHVGDRRGVPAARHCRSTRSVPATSQSLTVKNTFVELRIETPAQTSSTGCALGARRRCDVRRGDGAAISTRPRVAGRPRQPGGCAWPRRRRHRTKLVIWVIVARAGPAAPGR